MDTKINCYNVKQIFNSMYKEFSQITHSTLEVQENVMLADKLLLDIRTYICAHGKCFLHHNRSHRRLSNYNYNKMLNLSPDINKVICLANKIMYSVTQSNSNKKNKEMAKNKTQEQSSKESCVFCNNPKLTGIIHVHFVKEQLSITKPVVNKPIELVFSQIDKKASENAEKIRSKAVTNPPNKPINQNNIYRMSYGDINYLGNNKALLYFYRGIRGTQTFTNSMYPLKHHPKHKDIIILDDIVFTSTCKCESALQHREMFPHYRVTCAVGLTCPARLNSFDKEIFKRSRNASTEMYTTARSMLSRYWR